MENIQGEILQPFLQSYPVRQKVKNNAFLRIKMCAF
jgi:hypothetical protein